MAHNPHSVVEIDLGALRDNLEVVRSAIPPSTGVLAVVKADAYGHGALPVARCLQEAGVEMLGVANVAEGVELREGGITLPIVLLGGFQPGEEEEVLFNDLTPLVYRWDMAHRLASKASSLGKVAHVHLQVDTGMGRLGVPWEKAPELISSLGSLPSLRVDGMASHFATADEDLDYARQQLQRFLWVASEAKRMGVQTRLHIANSAAIFRLPEAHLDLVRPGITLYGAHPSAAYKDRQTLPLKPVMTWKAKVADIKDHPPSSSISYGRTFLTQRKSRIAAVPVGYADGYLRCLSNRSQVVIRGIRAPVVGRVTMDWIMVDVTHLSEVRLGDEVILLGGEGGISPEELASWADTIPYEIFCNAGRRSKRVYKGPAA